jgi:autotransporter-associated beta strand protein
VSFVDGGVLSNAGTLNSSVLDGPDVNETVINSGLINGSVLLGGSTDFVQLFTGSKITGSLGLSATNSTLILDGAGQQSLSLAIVGTLTNNGTLVKQGSGTWTIDRALASASTIIDQGTLIVDNAQALGTGDVTVNGGVLSADPQAISVKGNYTQNAGGPCSCRWPAPPLANTTHLKSMGTPPLVARCN